jgi:acyl-CoA synthetase (AMP-forming)/AMP-acid ligase II
LKEGTGATAEELITFCKKNLASYKALKSLEVINALSKNPTEKILKRVKREIRGRLTEKGW